MKSKTLHFLLLVGLVLGVVGCASNKRAVITPGADLGPIKHFYVVDEAGDNHRVNELICTELTGRGFQASHGGAFAKPEQVDAVLTYQARWVWDMTLYLLQLDMQIRNPQSNIPLATGTAMHTSLVRRTSETMIKEVLDEIYTAAGKPPVKAK